MTAAPEDVCGPLCVRIVHPIWLVVVVGEAEGNETLLAGDSTHVVDSYILNAGNDSLFLVNDHHGVVGLKNFLPRDVPEEAHTPWGHCYVPENRIVINSF